MCDHIKNTYSNMKSNFYKHNQYHIKNFNKNYQLLNTISIQNIQNMQKGGKIGSDSKLLNSNFKKYLKEIFNSYNKIQSNYVELVEMCKNKIINKIESENNLKNKYSSDITFMFGGDIPLNNLDINNINLNVINSKIKFNKYITNLNNNVGRYSHMITNLLSLLNDENENMIGRGIIDINKFTGKIKNKIEQYEAFNKFTPLDKDTNIIPLYPSEQQEYESGKNRNKNLHLYLDDMKDSDKIKIYGILDELSDPNLHNKIYWENDEDKVFNPKLKIWSFADKKLVNDISNMYNIPDRDKNASEISTTKYQLLKYMDYDFSDFNINDYEFVTEPSGTKNIYFVNPKKKTIEVNSKCESNIKQNVENFNEVYIKFYQKICARFEPLSPNSEHLNENVVKPVCSFMQWLYIIMYFRDIKIEDYKNKNINNIYEEMINKVNIDNNSIKTFITIVDTYDENKKKIQTNYDTNNNNKNKLENEIHELSANIQALTPGAKEKKVKEKEVKNKEEAVHKIVATLKVLESQLIDYESIADFIENIKNYQDIFVDIDKKTIKDVERLFHIYVYVNSIVQHTPMGLAKNMVINIAQIKTFLQQIKNIIVTIVSKHVKEMYTKKIEYKITIYFEPEQNKTFIIKDIVNKSFDDKSYPRDMNPFLYLKDFVDDINDIITNESLLFNHVSDLFYVTVNTLNSYLSQIKENMDNVQMINDRAITDFTTNLTQLKGEYKKNKDVYNPRIEQIIIGLFILNYEYSTQYLFSNIGYGQKYLTNNYRMYANFNDEAKQYLDKYWKSIFKIRKWNDECPKGDSARINIKIPLSLKDLEGGGETITYDYDSNKEVFIEKLKDYNKNYNIIMETFYNKIDNVDKYKALMSRSLSDVNKINDYNKKIMNYYYFIISAMIALNGNPLSVVKHLSLQKIISMKNKINEKIKSDDPFFSEAIYRVIKFIDKTIEIITNYIDENKATTLNYNDNIDKNNIYISIEPIKRSYIYLIFLQILYGISFGTDETTGEIANNYVWDQCSIPTVVIE